MLSNHVTTSVLLDHMRHNPWMTRWFDSLIQWCAMCRTPSGTRISGSCSLNHYSIACACALARKTLAVPCLKPVEPCTWTQCVSNITTTSFPTLILPHVNTLRPTIFWKALDQACAKQPAPNKPHIQTESSSSIEVVHTVLNYTRYIPSVYASTHAHTTAHDGVTRL